MTENPLHTLSEAGVAVWLDDLSRERLQSGNLAELVATRSVVGITTNPTIFASALAKGEAYDDQLKDLASRGADVDEAVFDITTDDVRQAADELRPVYERTNGVDGRVSIEVDPRLAHDTQGTVDSARELWARVDRPNVFIKIPATVEGLPAISTVLSEGISVNVTLIFGLDRYRAVMAAFLTGLEQAREAGRDLSAIQSVASFFVSRVDTEFDRRLEEIGTDEALALKSTAGLANARLAYAAFEEVFATPRWQVLAEAGAHPQRPLWASTGVKDPSLPDTLYVAQLVTAGVVNTMPEKTMEAFADHGEVVGDTIRDGYAEAQDVLDRLERVGVSYTDVIATIEREGVEKFEKSWHELGQTVREQLNRTDPTTDGSTDGRYETDGSATPDESGAS